MSRFKRFAQNTKNGWSHTPKFYINFLLYKKFFLDVPGITRSLIPYAPTDDVRVALDNAERQDFDALQNEVKEAMSRAQERNEMRNIQNFTDDYWLQLAMKQVGYMELSLFYQNLLCSTKCRFNVL